MGWVRRDTTGTQRWVAGWRDPEGVQRKKRFDRKSDAERFLVTVEASKHAGTYVDTSNRITVAEYAEEWAAARPHRDSTARRVGFMISTHIKGTHLGSMRLVQVRPSHVQAWATDRSQHLAPSTMRSLLGLLRTIFRAAESDGVIGKSPAQRIQLAAYEKPRVEALTFEQVQALANAMPERFRAIVLAQAGLGLRIGEVLALREQDIDRVHYAVRVEHQLERDTGRRVPPKTPTSRRTVPLPREVSRVLAEHMMRFPERGPNGEIFTGRTGKVVAHYTYGGSRVFGAAVRKAGLPDGTTSHDLRHHYASVLLHAGRSVHAVAAWMGHKDASLVLSTYGHLMPGSDEDARQAIDKVWRGSARAQYVPNSAPAAP